MKTIGLLGGTGWSSTIGYYTKLNQLVNERLGGYHSARIILYSIDYDEIMSNYGVDHVATAAVLERELSELLRLKPGCILICCNSLHKYYDMIKSKLNITIPVFHAVELVAEEAIKRRYRQVLLLATKFTMEDGFFAAVLEKRGVKVVIPNEQERTEMQRIHGELMKNVVTQKSRDYFAHVINNYKGMDAVVLGCTEYPLVVDQTNSALPIIDPVDLQVAYAVDYALKM